MEETVQSTESNGLPYQSVGPKFPATLPRKRNQKNEMLIMTMTISSVLVIKGHLLMSTPLLYKQWHDFSLPSPPHFPSPETSQSTPRLDIPADCSEPPNPQPQPISLFYTTNAFKVYMSPPG